MRKAGSFSEQFALLFRDYMRSHLDEAEAYANLKHELAERYRFRRDAYTNAKDPFIWQVMRRASDWSQQVGWEAGPQTCSRLWHRSIVGSRLHSQLEGEVLRAVKRPIIRPTTPTRSSAAAIVSTTAHMTTASSASGNI